MKNNLQISRYQSFEFCFSMQVYEIGIMSVEKFLLGMDSSQDRNLACWNWRIPLLFL
ncbi:hypothetical protein Peur_022340 [Populus x canadensis]